MLLLIRFPNCPCLKNVSRNLCVKNKKATSKVAKRFPILRRTTFYSSEEHFYVCVFLKKTINRTLSKWEPISLLIQTLLFALLAVHYCQIFLKEAIQLFVERANMLHQLIPF